MITSKPTIISPSFNDKTFLQYIGSKRKLIWKIAKYLKGKVVVDLMAGSHTLGYFLKDKVKVIANDLF